MLLTTRHQVAGTGLECEQIRGSHMSDRGSAGKKFYQQTWFWIAAVPVGLIVLFVVSPSHPKAGDIIAEGENLPSCNDSGIVDTLKQMVADTPEGRQGLVTLNSVTNIMDTTKQDSIGPVDYTSVVFCRAMFETNAGTEFRQYIIRRDNGRISVYIESNSYDAQRW
jgi:hypothetical protein